MPRKKRKFTAEFKTKVALAACREDRTVAQLASDFGIHPNLITNWKRQLLIQAIGIFTGEVKKSEQADDQLIGQLYQKIGQLEVQLDWLKKKL